LFALLEKKMWKCAQRLALNAIPVIAHRQQQQAEQKINVRTRQLQQTKQQEQVAVVEVEKETQKSEFWQEQKQVQNLKQDIGTDIIVYFAIDVTSSGTELHNAKGHDNPFRYVIHIMNEVMQSSFAAFAFGAHHNKATWVCKPGDCLNFSDFLHAYNLTEIGGSDSCLCSTLDLVKTTYQRHETPSVLIVLTDGFLCHSPDGSDGIWKRFATVPIPIYVISVDPNGLQQMRQFAQEYDRMHVISLAEIRGRDDIASRRCTDGQYLGRDFAKFLQRQKQLLQQPSKRWF
jgi:hypothetical protein